MHRKICVLIVLLMCLTLFGRALFANAAGEVKMDDKHTYLEALNYIDQGVKPLKTHFKNKKMDLNFFAGFLQGFDNNVNLDPERRKDGFMESSLNTELIYNYTDTVRLKAENYTTDVLYYNVKAANLLDIWNSVGLEVDLLDEMFTVGSGYAFDFVLFPCDKDGSYLSQEVKAFVKHNILPNLYHKMGYQLLLKGYTHDRTRDTENKKTEDRRKDNRNGMDYEVGIYLFDRIMLKTNIQFYRNDSNYQSFDYYDYWSFFVRPSCIVSITDKFSASGSFMYQQRRYDDRLSSENDQHVYDDTCTLNGSLLYDLSKSLTLAINLSYRENNSNEPLQKYSGTIITGGVYYSF